MLNDIQVLMSLLPLEADSWTVLLCPSPEKKQEAARLLASILPATAKFSGRTAVLKDGRRVSIAHAEEANFLPADTPYILAMLGWGSKDPVTGVQAWHMKSSGSLRVE